VSGFDILRIESAHGTLERWPSDRETTSLAFTMSL